VHAPGGPLLAGLSERVDLPDQHELSGDRERDRVRPWEMRRRRRLRAGVHRDDEVRERRLRRRVQQLPVVVPRPVGLLHGDGLHLRVGLPLTGTAPGAAPSGAPAQRSREPIAPYQTPAIRA
jgi:hypothetical protein